MERSKDGNRVPQGAPKHDFQDVEVITEFHIARDLKFAGWPLEEHNAEPSEDAEPSKDAEPKKDAPDVVIVAGEELVVCEGKYFSVLNVEDLKDQLRSQRQQVRHLFRNRRKLRAYRHVAILPEKLDLNDDVDAVLTWDDIRVLAQDLMGVEHYVTLRFREAVKRYIPRGDPKLRNYDGTLTFDEMREKCKKDGDRIKVGHMGGATELLRDLVNPDKKTRWKWVDPVTNKGNRDQRNWVGGARWLEIVESKRGA
jgi:hypothetical protein